jgi:hypothetical protein
MEITQILLNSNDPVVRYKTMVYVLGKDPASMGLQQHQDEIRRSERVKGLLADQDEHGEIPFHPYIKWQGAHWVLTCLADCAYPPGDQSLLPLRDQVYDWLFSEQHIEKFHKRTGKLRQVRLHASMEANALFSSLMLGLADSQTEGLVERLLWAQWDDGGWNCDRRVKADTSSFFESITPMRALAYYARLSGDPRAKSAVERAVEVFLKRRLFRRTSDGSIIREEFLKLRYPAYHYYNILWALNILAEASAWLDESFIGDRRCQEALDILEEKQLPGGGFAAEGKYYYSANKPGEVTWHGSRVDWGVQNRNKPNEFLTLEALAVLKAAGRFQVDVSDNSLTGLNA